MTCQYVSTQSPPKLNRQSGMILAGNNVFLEQTPTPRLNPLLAKHSFLQEILLQPDNTYINDEALLAETALQEWNTKEEDEAWAYLEDPSIGDPITLEEDYLCDPEDSEDEAWAYLDSSEE